MSMEWIRRTRATAALIVAAILVAGVLPVIPQEAVYPELDAQLEPLKARFNADAGKVRLILLLDPT